MTIADVKAVCEQVLVELGSHFGEKAFKGFGSLVTVFRVEFLDLVAVGVEDLFVLVAAH